MTLANQENNPTVNKFSGKSRIRRRGIKIMLAPIKAAEAINNPLKPSVIERAGKIWVVAQSDAIFTK